MSVLTLTGETFAVRVDYAQSLRDMIRCSRFRHADIAIDRTRFPSTRNDAEELVVQFAFIQGKAVATWTASEWLKANQLRAATLEEMLAVAAIEPVIHLRRIPCVLGSPWQDSDGKIHLVTCTLGTSMRLLRLVQVRSEPRWHPLDHCFPCVDLSPAAAR